MIINIYFINALFECVKLLYFNINCVLKRENTFVILRGGLDLTGKVENIFTLLLLEH